MPKKYRFRKMYFICEYNRVIEGNVWSTTVYQYKDYAQTICDQKDTHRYEWEKNKPQRCFKVEGFYLVHESLYEKLLKEFSEDEPQ